VAEAHPNEIGDLNRRKTSNDETTTHGHGEQIQAEELEARPTFLMTDLTEANYYGTTSRLYY